MLLKTWLRLLTGGNLSGHILPLPLIMVNHFKQIGLLLSVENHKVKWGTMVRRAHRNTIDPNHIGWQPYVGIFALVTCPPKIGPAESFTFFTPHREPKLLQLCDT